MRIPSPRAKRRAYESEALQEIVAFAVALIGLFIQVLVAAGDKLKESDVQKLSRALEGPDRDQKLLRLAAEKHELGLAMPFGWVLTCLGLLLLFALRYLRAKEKDLEASQMKSPEGLRGCAHVLYSILKIMLKVERDEGAVRVTVYRLASPDGGEATELEQAVDYVGVPEPTGMGRRFPIHAGIIGLTARTGQAQVATRQASDADHYRQELVEHWGYTDEMAKRARLDRRSFIAVPIRAKDKTVIGIVYADSSMDNAFAGVEEIIGAAASGFAAYIEERFK